MIFGTPIYDVVFVMIAWAALALVMFALYFAKGEGREHRRRRAALVETRRDRS